MIATLKSAAIIAHTVRARFVTHLPPPDQHNTLYDWQTLLAGALALAAAVIAAYISWGQLGAAKAQLLEMQRQADRDRVGRLRAARASLPPTLSAICGYATIVGRALHGQWPAEARLYPDQMNPMAAFTVNVHVPSFPETTLRTLERIVELTNDDGVAERIESILREAQVLDTRVAELRGGGRMTLTDLTSYIVEAGSIYARAESLFGYARRQTDTVDAGDLWDRVSAAMSIIGVHEPFVGDFMARARARGASPGEADRDDWMTPPVPIEDSRRAEVDLREYIAP